MEIVATEVKNCVIDWIMCASVVIFEGSDAFTWIGILCGIGRVEHGI